MDTGCCRWTTELLGCWPTREASTDDEPETRGSSCSLRNVGILALLWHFLLDTCTVNLIVLIEERWKDRRTALAYRGKLFLSR